MKKHYRVDNKYLCNSNIKPKKETATEEFKEVTCKNCKKIILKIYKEKYKK